MGIASWALIPILLLHYQGIHERGPNRREVLLSLYRPDRDPKIGRPLQAVASIVPSLGSEPALIIGMGSCGGCTAKSFDASLLGSIRGYRAVAAFDGPPSGQKDPKLEAIKGQFHSVAYLGTAEYESLNVAWPYRMYFISGQGLLLATQERDETPIEFLRRAAP